MRSKAKWSLLLISLGSGIFLLWFWYFRLRPADTASHERQDILIQQIAALGQLELLQYQVRDVLRKEWTYTIPFARSRLLLVVAGEARLCMDFARVRVVESDWDARRLHLRLPSPEVCVVRIDPARSEVYDADFSVIEWWTGSEAERVREALTAAQETLRVRLQRQLPYKAAQQQAETLLRRLCEAMGWREITFSHEEARAP